jgi:hypothetical protein
MNNKGIILDYIRMILDFAEEYDFTWQKVDEIIQSKHGKSISQIFGKDTQVLEYALLDLMVHLDPSRLELFSEYTEREIAKMYVEIRTANRWEVEPDELKRMYKTYKFEIQMIAALDIVLYFRAKIMLDLIESILTWKTYI